MRRGQRTESLKGPPPDCDCRCDLSLRLMQRRQVQQGWSQAAITAVAGKVLGDRYRLLSLVQGSRDIAVIGRLDRNGKRCWREIDGEQRITSQ